jgi:hypothetical protein
VELDSQPKASSGYARSDVTRRQIHNFVPVAMGLFGNTRREVYGAHYAAHIKYGHETQKSFYITTCSHISDVGTNDVNSCRNGKNPTLDCSAVVEMRTKTELPCTAEGVE